MPKASSPTTEAWSSMEVRDSMRSTSALSSPLMEVIFPATTSTVTGEVTLPRSPMVESQTKVPWASASRGATRTSPFGRFPKVAGPMRTSDSNSLPRVVNHMSAPAGLVRCALTAPLRRSTTRSPISASLRKSTLMAPSSIIESVMPGP